MSATLHDVEQFWDANVCGAHFVDDTCEYLSPEFFERYREFRYHKEHHLERLIDWSDAAGKDVLEIGLGLGADAVRWAERAASFTGIDLTDEAVNATRRHFEVLQIDGDIRQGNAEELPFEDCSFDLIYSHGVLHHTEDIGRAMREIHRVLRPSGTFIVMLYAKGSVNYWLRIQSLFRILFLSAMAKERTGCKLPQPWKRHLGNFHSRVWSYFSWSEWPHHCTDGPDCAIANVYSWRQTCKILRDAGFQITKREKAHLPIGVNGAVERFLARHLGFYQFAWCTK